jgi:internalin A
MSAIPVARRWRRFVRLSVRGLIVLVLVIGGWLGWLVRSARIQREAVEAITVDGGFVCYDWGRRNRVFIPGGKLWTPQWLVNLVGVDYFGHVTLVVFSDPSDAKSEQVGRLTGLEELFAGAVGDAGLAHLKELKNLTDLHLDYTKITDAGLAHLKGLNKLSSLDLASTQVTDAGLTNLKGLTNLSTLNLYGTQVTDAGVKELQQALPSLTITR